MYSWEIRDYLRKRNYRLGGDEIAKVTSYQENPQLVQISYFPSVNTYYMKDDQQEEFYFEPMSYDEAVAKGFVKSKRKEHDRSERKE